MVGLPNIRCNKKCIPFVKTLYKFCNGSLSESLNQSLLFVSNWYNWRIPKAAIILINRTFTRFLLLFVGKLVRPNLELLLTYCENVSAKVSMVAIAYVVA